MKVPFTLGTVGHFGLAVTSPKRSAKWFERALGLSVEFEYEDGIAVGNKNVTIALFQRKTIAGNDWSHVVSLAWHDNVAKGTRTPEANGGRGRRSG